MDPRPPDDQAVPSDAELRRALTRGLDGPVPGEEATVAVHRRAWARRARRRRAVLAGLALGAVALLAPAVAWAQRASGPDGGVDTAPAATVPSPRPAGPPSTVVPPSTALALPAPTLPPGVTTTTTVRLGPPTSFTWPVPTPAAPPTAGLDAPAGAAYRVQWWPGGRPMQGDLDPTSTLLPVDAAFTGPHDGPGCLPKGAGAYVEEPLVVETDEYVLIRLYAIDVPVATAPPDLPPGVGFGCTADLRYTPAPPVALAAPLGDRALYDGATSPPERRR